MTLLIFPDRNTPHWAIADEQTDGQRARPHPASRGYPTFAQATQAALQWAEERGQRIEAVTGRADKKTAREFGVRYADPRGGARRGVTSTFESNLRRLYEQTVRGDVPDFAEFQRRLAQLHRD